MFYVSFYGPWKQTPFKSLEQARAFAVKLLNNEEYGEIEVPIYDKRTTKYGNFYGVVYTDFEGSRYYWEERQGSRYTIYKNGKLHPENLKRFKRY